jgi:hypothetical protein
VPEKPGDDSAEYGSEESEDDERHVREGGALAVNDCLLGFLTGANLRCIRKKPRERNPSEYAGNFHF